MEKRGIQKKYLLVIGIFVVGIALTIALNAAKGQEVKMLKAMLSHEGKITELTGFADDAVMAENFPAVRKAYLINGEYVGFLVETIGYSGPMSILTALGEGGENEGIVTGIRILSHSDTPEYADPIMENWFLDRFKLKGTEKYLSLAPLEAQYDNEIIQVTGATISSRAVVNGVNAAIGAFQYLAHGNVMEAVPSVIHQEMWDNDANSFSISWPGGEERISLDDLAQFRFYTLDTILQKTSGTQIKIQAEGPYLADVIESKGLKLEAYQGIGVTGRDGYYTLIDKDKLNGPVMLAVFVDGKELKQEEKPTRLVLPEQMGPYWVKMISRIELYDEIAPREISALHSFDALSRDIEPHYYEYYGSKDKSIEVGKILRLFTEVDEKGFFVMASVDGLEKNETISMVRERYFIKNEGKNAPMNIAPGFRLGMNVKEMAWFSTTKDAVFFPDKMKNICRTKNAGGKEWMLLEDVMANVGLLYIREDHFSAKSAAGAEIQIRGGEIGDCYVSAGADRVDLMLGESVVLEDFLSISKAQV